MTGSIFRSSAGSLPLLGLPNGKAPYSGCDDDTESMHGSVDLHASASSTRHHDSYNHNSHNHSSSVGSADSSCSCMDASATSCFLDEFEGDVLKIRAQMRLDQPRGMPPSERAAPQNNNYLPITLPGMEQFIKRMNNSDKYLQEEEDEEEDVPVAQTVLSHFHSMLKEDLSEKELSAVFTLQTGHHHFLPISDERVQAYTPEASRAMRALDLNTLKRLVNQGHSLEACNNQGESLMHLACRRNSLEVVEFMIREASVSLHVRDDFGKTCMHEICWSPHPNFNLAKLLLMRAPALLLTADKRSYVPLQYVPRSCRDQWCHFLEQNKSLIRLAVQRGRYDRAREKLQATLAQSSG